MTKTQKELLDKISKCDDELTVGQACGIVVQSLTGLEDQTNTFEKFFEQGNVNGLLDAIFLTVFAGFYLNCNLSEEAQQERIHEFTTIFADRVKGYCFAEKEKIFKA